MSSFSDYGFIYPNLVRHLWDYYTDKTIRTQREINFALYGIPEYIIIKSPLDFVMSFYTRYHKLGDTQMDYKIIAKICDKLYDHDYLLKYKIGTFNLNEGYNYYTGYKETGKSKELLDLYKDNEELIMYILNSLVYGFKYIYEYNKKNILPLYVKKGGREYIGTCFKTIHGIVTAKHCITNTNSVQIEGIGREALVNCNVLAKGDLDLVVIQPNADYPLESFLLTSNCGVLDEIMVMGYPSHCGFNNFVTATMGSIAAIEKSYLTNYELMLLTSKVKGGNSGGPVLNEEGYVVGIVTERPNPEGEGYDQFGYGLAMPQHYIDEIVNEGQQIDEKINFE